METQAAKPRSCAPGVCDPERTQGLRAPVPKGDHVLVSLKGPGLFLAAEVVKQGGSNDLTFVILDIDSRNVTNLFRRRQELRIDTAESLWDSIPAGG